MTARRRTQAVSLAVAIAAALIGLEARGYPWSLATIFGAACGAFAWVVLERVGQIAAMLRNDRPPGEDDQRGEQRQVDPAAEDHSGPEGNQPGREQAEGQGQSEHFRSHGLESTNGAP